MRIGGMRPLLQSRGVEVGIGIRVAFGVGRPLLQLRGVAVGGVKRKWTSA
jgi:hypothetical protein